MMIRYHEEQLWSDKIRSASTILTSSIVIFNVIFFLGMQTFVESRRRQRLVDKFGDLLVKQTQEEDKKLDNGIIQPSMKKFETLEKKMDQLLKISTGTFTGDLENMTSSYDSSKVETVEGPMHNDSNKKSRNNKELPMTREELGDLKNQHTRKPIELTRDEFDNIIVISALLGASVGLFISVMVTKIFSR